MSKTQQSTTKGNKTSEKGAPDTRDAKTGGQRQQAQGAGSDASGKGKTGK